MDTNPSPTSPPEKSVTDMSLLASRMNVAEWLATERREYADKKWTPELRRDEDLNMGTFGLADEGTAWTFLTTYLRRAQLLGLDTPQGRQAFGKFVVTALSVFESSVRVYGKPPKPGVASGVIE